MNKLELIGVAVAVAGLGTNAPAAIINVGPGESIQTAINSATNGDEIIVAPGLYDTESINFLGKAITVRSSDGAAVTTIARPPGVGGTVVIIFSGEGPDSVLQGFTVTGGDTGCVISSASATVKNCVFTLLGIGIQVSGDSGPRIVECSFINNGPDEGAAIQVSSSVPGPTIVGCTFSNNSSPDRGGAVFAGGTTTIIDSTFTGNQASSGGAIHISVNAVIKNSVFTNNTVDFGGAISNGGGATMVNCLFAGNQAIFGGAFFDVANFNMPVITNCTIANNTAAVGGGILIDAFTVLTMYNSIVWGNTPNQIVADDLSVAVVRYSNVEGYGWPGPGNFSSDPLFVDPDNGDFHLLLSPVSFSIDAAHNWAVPIDTIDLDGDADTTELTPLDLDGNPRFADVVASPDTGCGATAIVDMGAYEFPGNVLDCLRPGDVNGDGAVDVLDLIDLLLSFGASCEDVCCLADFDLSGTVDVLDLIELLMAFGATCP